jgi:hypothetical protein
MFILYYIFYVFFVVFFFFLSLKDRNYRRDIRSNIFLKRIIPRAECFPKGYYCSFGKIFHF